MRHSRPRIVLVAAILALLLISPSLQVFPVHAGGTWYVANGGGDANDCATALTPCATINGAVGKAASGDTVRVAVGTYTGTGNIIVTIAKNVNLSGGWDSSFTSQAGFSTIDGQGVRQGISVVIGTATIDHFVVQNGHVASGGGGIENSGDLTVNWTQISNNSAGETGAVGTFGGGILNGSKLVLNNSSVTNNYLLGTSSGSGVYNVGQLSINNSTISGNSQQGVYVEHPSATTTINNSTITDNGWVGIFDFSGMVTVRNSIVLNNHPANEPYAISDCYSRESTVQSQGYNFIGRNDGCTLLPSDLIGVDAAFLPLQGLPKFRPLLPSSPAVNAGNPSGCVDHLGNPLTTDQRGAARVGRCDIGAYEYTTSSGTGVRLYPAIDARQTAPLSVPFNLPLRVAVLDSLGNYVQGNQVNYAAPASNPTGAFQDTGTRNTSAVSDASGIVTPSKLVAGGTTGTYVVTASASGATLNATFTLTNTARVPLSAASGTPQSTSPNMAFPLPLQALARDDMGNPLGGITVLFTAPGSGASLTFEDTGTNTTTAVSDGQGLATTSKLTANGNYGSYQVTATVPGASGSASFALTNGIWIYLPFVVLDHCTGIKGRMMNGDTSSGNVPLELRFFDGAAWSTKATQWSHPSNGTFMFTGIPSLGSGQKYYVRYPNKNDPSKLGVWQSQVITSYVEGSCVDLGMGNIRGISLLSPVSGATVPLPTKFSWQIRVGAKTDSYEWNLFSPSDPTKAAWTAPLGYVGAYNLTAIPTGFSAGNPYGWYVSVRTPDGSYGTSYYYRRLAFMNMGTGRFEVPLKSPWLDRERWTPNAER